MGAMPEMFEKPDMPKWVWEALGRPDMFAEDAIDLTDDDIIPEKDDADHS